MQHELFHESLTDALRDLVRALGGTKKVGAAMRPEKMPDEAGRWLNDCLNAERREHLTPEQLQWLLREGRRIGCHAAMAYLNTDAGYGQPAPVEPADELAELQKQFISATKGLNQMLNRIEQISGGVSAIRRVS